MKFLIVLALVGVASCAPAAENRDKRSFGLPFAPAAELVQSRSSEEESNVVQSTNIQSNNKKSTSLKQSLYQPYQAPAFFQPPPVYGTPQFEAVAYPVQSRPVYNYLSPQYAYRQPIETYPVRSYDLSYPVQSYNANYYQPNYAYANGLSYPASFNGDVSYQPSVSYSSAAVPTVY